MTMLQKMILSQIKAHNENDADGYLAKFNKGLKFLDMSTLSTYMDGTPRKHFSETGFFDKRGQRITVCSYGVRCTFKPVEGKFADNVVKYEFCVYSDGTTSLFFDGTEYMSENDLIAHSSTPNCRREWEI